MLKLEWFWSVRGHPWSFDRSYSTYDFSLDFNRNHPSYTVLAYSNLIVESRQFQHVFRTPVGVTPFEFQ